MLFGWLQDTHTHRDPGLPQPGAQQELVDDYNYLDNNRGVAEILHGGDLVHADDNTDTPHITAAAMDRFWSLIGQTNDPTLLTRAVPGNHDVPLSTFAESDPRCVLRDRVDYPSDSLSVLFINTRATGTVTGSPGTNEQGGVGTEIPRLGYADLQWLDDQLADIPDGHAKMVFGHASPYFLDNAAYADVQSANAASGAKVLGQNSAYNVCSNYNAFHDVLSSYQNVVVPVSHLYQFDDEGSQTIDGVHYVWKKHYWYAPDNTFHTFGEIDITGAGATITTIEHSNKAMTTVLDVTF